MSTSRGVVAFLFTDLVGSTEMLRRLGEDRAEDLRRTHFGLLRQAVAERGGEEVKNLGDGLMVAFASPSDALACAVAMQQAVEAHNTGCGDEPLQIRIGVHAGEPQRDENDFFGTAVVVAKRLCDTAAGGHILASDLVATLAGSRGGLTFRPAGRVALKGLGPPIEAVFVEAASTAPAPVSAATPAFPTRAPAPVPVPGPRLVGRAGELAVLETELERAGGGFRCVVVLGEAGVGKTRLTSEFVARHGDRVTALTARAFAMGQTVPFGVWSEALERCLRTVPAAEVSQLCGGFLEDLAGLVRSVAAARGVAPDREPSRSRLLEGLAVVMANLAAAQPVAVVLDDMHLADASSWETLGYLSRDLAAHPLLVVLAARADELANQTVATQVLLGLESDGMLCRLRLRPLATEAVGDLAGALLGEEPPAPLVTWLNDRSQGNPLFALGLLRALLEEGADLTAPHLASLPEALAARVTSRLQAVDDTSRRVLEVLALLGRPVELGDLLRFTGETLEAIATVVAGLVRSRLVLEDERASGLTYEIAHPLVAETIYEQLGGAHRRVLHRRVGRSLLELGRPGEAAPHFARSAEVGDDEAVGVLCEALSLAEQREAYIEALTILGALVGLLPAGDRRWLTVADAMAGPGDWVLEHRSDPAALAAEHALRAVDAHLEASGDRERQASSKLRLTHFLAFGTGDLADAEAAGRRAVTLFESIGDHARSLMAATEVVWVRGLGGDFTGMESEALSVIDQAEALGTPVPLLRGAGALATARMTLGRFEEGENFRRMASLAEAVGSAYYRTLALVNVATALGLEGRAREALAVLDETRGSDPNYRKTPLLEVETFVHWLSGDMDRALSRARDAETWNVGGTSLRRGMGTVYAALAAIEADEIDEARRLVGAAEGLYRGRRWHVFSDAATWAAGVLAWNEGRHADAVVALRRAASRLSAIGAWPHALFVWVDLAEVGADGGDAEVAAVAAERMNRFPASTGGTLQQGLLSLGRGWAALAVGDGRRAAEEAARAVALLRTTDCRAFVDRSLVLTGRVRQGNDPAAARSAFEEAADGFSRRGARWRARRAVESTAARAGPAPAGLSPRELEVARLACQGLTAKQIAERLFIGERTVETHLTRVYAKLGVESKLELVRRGAELGI